MFVKNEMIYNWNEQFYQCLDDLQGQERVSIVASQVIYFQLFTWWKQGTNASGIHWKIQRCFFFYSLCWFQKKRETMFSLREEDHAGNIKGLQRTSSHHSLFPFNNPWCDWKRESDTEGDDFISPACRQVDNSILVFGKIGRGIFN